MLGNLLWLIFGGFIGASIWFVVGILLCTTIIGIPLGVQAFKLAGYVLMPFGRETYIGDFGIGGAIGNFIWVILFGWELTIYHLVMAFFLSITIIGIPFGQQHIKIARLALLPFGARIRFVE